MSYSLAEENPELYQLLTQKSTDAKTIQSLHVPHHFDNMRAQWITFFQLAIHQESPDFEPFGPSLNLEHAFKTLDHIKSPNVFKLLLQLRIH